MAESKVEGYIEIKVPEDDLDRLAKRVAARWVLESAFRGLLEVKSHGDEQAAAAASKCVHILRPLMVGVEDEQP